MDSDPMTLNRPGGKKTPGNDNPCHNLTRTCHNLTRTCHNLTRTCHNLTRTSRNLTWTCHNLTRTCHNLTQTCHNLTQTSSTDRIPSRSASKVLSRAISASEEAFEECLSEDSGQAEDDEGGLFNARGEKNTSNLPGPVTMQIRNCLNLTGSPHNVTVNGNPRGHR
jgi:hypothetical protein